MNKKQWQGEPPCAECNTHEEVHSCWKCNIYKCIECDADEMRSDLDGHTYCSNCGPEEAQTSINMDEKKRNDILLNGMLGERWEDEEQMYNGMAYHLAEEQVVADHQMAFGLANCNQDDEMYNDIWTEIMPLVDALALKIHEENTPEQLVEKYVKSKGQSI